MAPALGHPLPQPPLPLCPPGDTQGQSPWPHSRALGLCPPRRSINKGARFTCPFARSCPVTKAKRRQCQACRLQKCLDVGMRKDSERGDTGTAGGTRGRGAGGTQGTP
uniref:Nuclear receptor domain-containing protein n=1 Tax=Otus sunia TaxID=257818 RepID=A0A8C8BDZ1_9STRI